ncbi:P-loop NTPase fold protein, partial [Clostridium perfringens]|nr:P-loop NTPase fold protein [Clostridium perfringens]
IRTVGDLPNIIYILCYDEAVLSRSVEAAHNIKNGRDYLEKIVQHKIMVPKPEEFQLRHWFSEELGKFAFTKGSEELSRLKEIIDTVGGFYLRTP